MRSVKYTVRAEINSRANRFGKHAIYIRITHNRQRIRLALNATVDAAHWDPVKELVKKSNPNSTMLNEMIRSKISEVEKFIFDQQLKSNSPSINAIKNVIVGGGNSELQIIRIYAEHLCEQVKDKFSDATLSIYRNEARRIDEFDNGATFDNISHRWMVAYEAHLRKQGMEQNSVHKAFKTLSKFFNSARKDGITNNYPFNSFARPKYEQSDRVHLTAEEVERIEKALKLPMDKRLRRVATWFLFGCYSGLRFSDWQRFDSETHIRGKDIVLRAKKNGELVVMPIHSKLRKVLERLEEVGPVEAEPSTNEILKSVAKLCEIKKHLTTHVARHSFAVRCLDLGISMETVAELMGISMKVVSVYAKVTGTKVRKEMEKWG